MNTKKLLGLSEDIVEVLYNDVVSSKPFLIRLSNYSNEKYDIRLDLYELESLCESLLFMINNHKRLKAIELLNKLDETLGS